MRKTQLQPSDDRWLGADGTAARIVVRDTTRVQVARPEKRMRRSQAPRGERLSVTDWNACYDLRPCLRDRFARRFHLGL